MCHGGGKLQQVVIVDSHEGVMGQHRRGNGDVLRQVGLRQLPEGSQAKVGVVGVGDEGLVVGQFGARVFGRLVASVTHAHRVASHGQVAREGLW